MPQELILSEEEPKELNLSGESIQELNLSGENIQELNLSGEKKSSLISRLAVSSAEKLRSLFIPRTSPSELLTLPGNILTAPGEAIAATSKRGRELDALAEKKIEELAYSPTEHPELQAFGTTALSFMKESVPTTPEEGVIYALGGKGAASVLSNIGISFAKRYPKLFAELIKKRDISFLSKLFKKEVPIKEGTDFNFMDRWAKLTGTQPIKEGEKPVQYLKTVESPGIVSEPATQGGRQRQFLETVAESPQSAEETVKAAVSIKPQTYTPISNKESFKSAEEIVTRSEDEAIENIFAGDLTVDNAAEKGAMAITLIKKMESEGRWDALESMLSRVDELYRAGGRLIQTASAWNVLTPSGIGRMANKVAGKHGIELSKDFKKNIMNRMSDIRKMSDSEEKAELTMYLLKDIAKEIPLSKGELFNAYRYFNMLTNPLSHARNIVSNLSNTFIARPADLGAEALVDLAKHPFMPILRETAFKDVPIYYKHVFKSIPDSIVAMKEAFKRGISIKVDDIGFGKNIIESMRRAQVPAPLSYTTKALEAADSFSVSMIAAGEKARLMSHGMSEAEATAKAIKVANDYTYRGQLKSGADASFAVRAIDNLSTLVLKARDVKVFGPAISWFAPFVTVPANLAKENVKHTVLGLAGGDITKAKIAQALSGSAVMGWGAIKAYNGEVTWSPPKNESAKKAFYDAGKKPYSVNIKGVDVPLWAFGTYALSMAIPAAVRYNFEESEGKMTDNQVQKLSSVIGDLSRFVLSQTAMTGFSTFLKVLDGEEDYTMGRLTGFTAGQFIPAEGLVKYVNSIIDPVFRKGGTFEKAIQKDIPILSKQLEPYTTLTGKEAKRKVSDYILPWSVGIVNPETVKDYLEMYGQTPEEMYRELLDVAQQRAVISKEKKKEKSKYIIDYFKKEK